MSDKDVHSKTEEICCICLGEVNDKALLDMCLHFFCFGCIKRWSEKKTSCPLCTVQFRTIMYNIKSDYEYLELRVGNEGNLIRDQTRDLLNETRFIMNTFSERNRDGERDLATVMDRRRDEVSEIMLLMNSILESNRRLTNGATERAANLLTRSRWAPAEETPRSSSVPCRSEIYKMNLWAKDLKATEGIPVRVRDVTPTFLSRNEACCHRLYRWLNREVPVVLGHSRFVEFSEVMSTVIDNCKKFFILSEDFYDKIHKFFGSKTKHFVHEFHRFASSPYDMEDYDKNVIYGPQVENSLDVTLSSESEVEDVVVVHPSSSQDSTVLLLDDDDEDDDDDDDDIFVTTVPSSSQQRGVLASSELVPISHDAEKKACLQRNSRSNPSRSKAAKKRKIQESDIEEDEDRDDFDDHDADDDSSDSVKEQRKKVKSKIQASNRSDNFMARSEARIEVECGSFKKHHSGHKNRPKWRL